MKTIILASILLLSNAIAYAGIYADYDYNCDSMLVNRCPIEHIIFGQEKLTEVAPKIIHRIWLGDQSKLSSEKHIRWEEYARRFNYQSILWTEKNENRFKEIMDSKNFDLYLKFKSEQNWWAASDILRLELLKKFGGIYIDCDFNPPKNNDDYIDFNEIIPMQGLILMTEHQGRNIGSANAVFVCNGLIVSPPNHPIICSCVDQVYGNTMSWWLNGRRTDAMYCTGPFLLNKVLNGPFLLIPGMYLKHFNMY